MSMIGNRSTGRISQVRMFLKAGTPEELVRLQLQTNTFLRGQANYTDIQFVKDSWYAWFLVDLDAHPEFLGAINGTVSDTVR